MNYPAGVDQFLATVLFSHIIAEYDDIYRFEECDPVSELWLQYGDLHGRYPRLEDVKFRHGQTLHFFADGSVITQSTSDPTDVAYL